MHLYLLSKNWKKSLGHNLPQHHKEKSTEEGSERLPFHFLFLTIFFGSIGTFTNFYSTIYLKWNFNMSKMSYKLLMWGSLVTLAECLLEVIIAILLSLTANELACMIFQIAYLAPKFIVNSFVLQISLLRWVCIFYFSGFLELK